MHLFLICDSYVFVVTWNRQELSLILMFDMPHDWKFVESTTAPTPNAHKLSLILIFDMTGSLSKAQPHLHLMLIPAHNHTFS